LIIKLIQIMVIIEIPKLWCILCTRKIPAIRIRHCLFLCCARILVVIWDMFKLCPQDFLEILERDSIEAYVLLCSTLSRCLRLWRQARARSSYWQSCVHNPKAVLPSILLKARSSCYCCCVRPVKAAIAARNSGAAANGFLYVLIGRFPVSSYML